MANWSKASYIGGKKGGPGFTDPAGVKGNKGIPSGPKPGCVNPDRKGGSLIVAPGKKGDKGLECCKAKAAPSAAPRD